MSAHTDIAPVLCEDVSFTYPGDGITALDGVSLEVRQGEFVALAGMNGSGKSTLCRLLNALILPTRGKVVSCGLDTALPENLAGIRSRVGLIMQNPDNQIVGPTVEDDVAFGLENLGLPREEMLSRVQDALEAMGLSSLRRREPHLLSIGRESAGGGGGPGHAAPGTGIGRVHFNAGRPHAFGDHGPLPAAAG